MSTNLSRACTCSHHRLLDFIEEEKNDAATSLLHKLGNPCDVIKNSKTTLLHYAIQYRNTTIVQPLIDYGCNVNAADTSGLTPLMLAIQNSDLEAVEILLKNYADVYVSTSSGENPLQMACSELYGCFPYQLPRPTAPELTVLKKVIEKANEDFFKNKTATKRSVLFASNEVKLAVVANANVELARIVLKLGFSLKYREPRCGFTALHVAIMFKNIENILLLIEHGADVDAQDYSQHSSIHTYLFCCQTFDENSEVLKKLLNRTKGLYFRNGNSQSDFEHLLAFGNARTVRAALKKASHSLIKISAMIFTEGKSLLHVLAQNPKELDVCTILDDFDFQYDVNARDARGRTALTLALKSGNFGVVEFLLKHEAKFEEKHSRILLDAVERLHSGMQRIQDYMGNVVTILLEHGIDVQRGFKDGESLIQHLCHERAGKPLNNGEKMVTAHLALLAKIEDSALTARTREDIESEKLFKDHFDICTKQLEELKEVEFYGTVTLLDLLTKDQNQMTAYASNEELIAAFRSTMEKNSHLERYYSIMLSRRVTKAIDASELKKKLVYIISELTGISSVFCIIMDNIINNLSFLDKRNLSKVEDLLDEKK